MNKILLTLFVLFIGMQLSYAQTCADCPPTPSCTGPPTMEGEFIGCDEVPPLECFYLSFEAATDVFLWACIGALPVELISFAGQNDGDDNVLRWSTATELNNAGFEIQRSFNGFDFETISFVEGRGTTSEIQEYLFTDVGIAQNATQKTVYYRLKQIDHDGEFEIFDMIVIEMDIDIAEFEITKVAGTQGNTRLVDVHFQADERTQKVRVTLSNINGSFIQRSAMEVSETGLNKIEYDLSNAPDGIYVISINNGKDIINQKFVLQGDH